MASLSVVIPTRNRARLLERSVRSALEAGAEVIVVDDASSDGTAAVVERLSGSDLHYRRLCENKGPGFARNLGVEVACGELVLFLDDDDYLLPCGGEAIRSVADASPEYYLYLHNLRLADDSCTVPPELGAVPYSYQDWLTGRFEGDLAPVIRRELFETYRQYDTGAGGEGLLWGEVIRDRGALVSGTPVIQCDDAAGGDRLTSPSVLLARARENAAIAEQMLQAHGAELEALDPRRWAQRVLAAATYNLLAGRRDRARLLLAGIPPSRMSRAQRAAFNVASRAPMPVIRRLFLSYRSGGRAVARRRGR